MIIVDHAVRVVLIEEPGLLLIDIKPGRADLSCAQPLDKILSADELSASGIDNHHSRLHHVYSILIYHMQRLMGQRTVERDDVALGI